jgi:hypothetical protein
MNSCSGQWSFILIIIGLRRVRFVKVALAHQTLAGPGQAIFQPHRRHVTDLRPATFVAILPNEHLLIARSKLLVALSEKLDQSVHAALLDLVAELLPVCLDQPDAEHVQVI